MLKENALVRVPSPLPRAFLIFQRWCSIVKGDILSKKPFFVRIDIASFLDFATDPEGINMTLLQFGKALQKGDSDIPYIQSIINETHTFIEKKKAAGSKGGEAKASSAKAKASSAKAPP